MSVLHSLQFPSAHGVIFPSKGVERLPWLESPVVKPHGATEPKAHTMEGRDSGGMGHGGGTSLPGYQIRSGHVGGRGGVAGLHPDQFSEATEFTQTADVRGTRISWRERYHAGVAERRGARLRADEYWRQHNSPQEGAGED